MERLLASRHLVDERSERKNVRAGVGFLGFQLLGSHVLERPENRALSRQVLALGRHLGDCSVAISPQLRKTEIQQFRARRGQHHVRRLQVAMDDPLPVRLVERGGDLEDSIARFDQIIAQQFAVHPEHALFESFPGAGPVYAPRLLTALGTDRSHWTSAADLQCHSGIAPVTVKSGKSCWVHRRLACSNFVRQTFHECAAQSIRFSTWARAYYDQMRGRSLRHPAALRALAFKWIRIICRC